MASFSTMSAPAPTVKRRDNGWKTLDEEHAEEPPQIIRVPISSIEATVTAKLQEMVQVTHCHPATLL